MVLLEYIISNKQWNEIFLALRQMENLKKNSFEEFFSFSEEFRLKSDEFLLQSFKDMLSMCEIRCRLLVCL